MTWLWIILGLWVLLMLLPFLMFLANIADDNLGRKHG